MKQILATVLMLIATYGSSQTDHNGNPVFNSISTAEEVVKDFRLISNYYTLKNNIENRGSSVYISDKPTLQEMSNAATMLPSDFFVIMKGQSIVNMIILVNQPSKKFLVHNPNTGKQNSFDCSIKGDITENRANEIIRENYDPKAKIDGNKFYFNDGQLKIISNKLIRAKVLELIEKQKLGIGDTSGIKILSREEVRAHILVQTKEGGELDFFTPIKGKEYDGVQIKPGLFTTNLGVALYKWGRSNFDLGVNTVEDALSIFAEFKGRELNQREKDYIKRGFHKELEK